MVIVTGRIKVRAGAEAEAERLCIEHSRRSRLEPGCLHHAAHRDLEDPSVVVFLEHWADRAALDTHFAVPESGRFVQQISDLATEPPVMHISTVSGGRSARVKVVHRHMEAENREDFDEVMGTFTRPRYELVPTGRVFDGESEVRDYFARSRAAVPDQRNENAVLHDAGDVVVAEFDLLGTPTATGQPFRVPMVALFFFEGDGIVCERVYWDTAAISNERTARDHE